MSAARRGWSEGEFLAVAFLAALVLRAAWSLHLPPTIVWFDGQQYSRLALGLLRDGTYLNVRGRPSAFWPPGYPALLAGVYAVAGPSVQAVRLVQALLGALTVLPAHALARRAAGERAARLAAVATAVYPLFVYAAGTFFPVTLLAALLAFALWLAVLAVERASHAAAAAAGALGGWAVLAAGSSLPALLVVAGWMVLRGADRGAFARRSRAAGARLAVVFLLPLALVVGSWTARNAHVFGTPVLVSTNGGYNFWLGNYPGVTAGTGNARLSDAMEAEAAAVWATPGSEQTRDRAFWDLGRRHVAEDVPRFVRLSLAKAGLFWSVVAEPLTADRPRLPIEALASWLSYGLLLPFALGWLLATLRRDPLAGLVLALAVVYTAVHAVVLAKVRFRLPIDVLVIVYGCGGLVAAWDLVTARRPDAAGRDRGR